jgi:hypothetical protein
MKTFKASIEIIGINPFVFLPIDVLNHILKNAGKDKGAIPVILSIGYNQFLQHLVRYKGSWRLYINTPMLKAANKNVGDEIEIGIAFDGNERITEMHPRLIEALDENKAAHGMFHSLTPSLQKEIKRYINNLKTSDAIERNITKAILFLTTKERFIGRDGLGA